MTTAKTLGTNDLIASAGSATARSAVFWALSSQPFKGRLEIMDVVTGAIARRLRVNSNQQADHIVKQQVNGLSPGKTYSYIFHSQNQDLTSEKGFIKTTPRADALTGVRFGFSGCASAAYAPHNSLADIPSKNLDFFIMLGDAAYEDPYTDRNNNVSAEAKPPFDPINTSTTSSTAISDTTAAMSAKYRDNLTANLGNLAPVYRAQGIYAVYDNHEMIDMALEAGGAPRTAIQSFKDNDGNWKFREGADFDATNANNMIFNRSGNYLNKSPEHRAVLDTWLRYMPIAKPRLHSTPQDRRTDRTYKLYNSQQWGKHVLLINTDNRSYRDAKLTQLEKDGTGFDETDYSGVDVNNSLPITQAKLNSAKDSDKRTLLGATQLKFVKQQLLRAQRNGTTWKFVNVSSPIDATGLMEDGKVQSRVNNGHTWIDNKSWWGNYQKERNNLLSFIARKRIKNVAFIATDDHEARVNEISYAPDGVALDDLINYRTVPGAISVVASPIGALRPAEAFQGKDLVQLSETLSEDYKARNLDPIGLRAGYPGLVSLRRQPLPGHTQSDVNNPKPIDFWVPDKFNYALMEVSDKGRLSVSIRGIDAFPANNRSTNPFPAGAASDVAEILSFSLDPLA